MKITKITVGLIVIMLIFVGCTQKTPDVVQTIEQTEESAKDNREETDEVYRHLLMELVETGMFPGTDNQCDGDPLDNTYSIMDVDDDGQEELLINFSNANSMAGTVLYIYDYDRETGEAYIEYSGFPLMTIYDNGYLKQEASHNHGRSSMDDFWPYSLYQYNGELDKYERVAMIDAWEYQIVEGYDPDPEFPIEKDIDGNGVVFYDMSDNYYEPTWIKDDAEYHKWCEQYNTGNQKEIVWLPITNPEEE